MLFLFLSVVETPNLDVIRRLSAPLGDKIFLDLGQGMGVTDELLGGGEAMH